MHEIVDETGRLFNQTKENDGLNTFKTTSANNASSGVSSPSINIISDTDTNYNTDTEKNIATLPDRLAQNKPITEHTADESRQIVAQAMLID